MMSAGLLVLSDGIVSIGNFFLRHRQVYQEPLLASGKAKDGQQAETRFASTLPLDRAAETVASMIDDDYDVRLMRLSDDKFTFTIQQIGSQYMPQIRGTLHRWNHDETKLDVSRDNFFEMKDADAIINRLIDALGSEGDVDVLGG